MSVLFQLLLGLQEKQHEAAALNMLLQPLLVGLRTGASRQERGCSGAGIQDRSEPQQPCVDRKITGYHRIPR